MATTISQRIELSGGEEIARQLAAAGKAAGDMGKQMSAAAVRAAADLNKVVQAVANVEERFAALGAAARNFGQSFSGVGAGLGAVESAATRVVRQITLVAGAATGAATAFGLLVKSSADAADKIDEQSQALGLSAKAFQAFELGAKQAGVSGTQFSTALSRLSKDVDKEAGEQRKAINELAKDLLKPLPAPTIPFQNLGKVREAFQGIAREIQAELAKVGSNKSLGQITQGLIQLAAGSEEARKEFKKLGVDIPIDKVGLLDDRLKSLNAKSLADLGISVRDAAGNLRPLEGVLGDLAERFKELGPGTEATSLAIARFGQRVGPKLLPFLFQGRKGVQDLIKEFEKLDIGFSDEQIASGAKLADSFDVLGAAVRGLKNQFGAQFFGLFQGGVDVLIDSLSAAVPRVKALGQEIARLVEGPFKSLLGLLTGQFEDESQLEVADKLAASFEKFRTQAVAAIDLVIRAFQGLATAVETIAAPIQKVFGTELSGGAILAAAAVLRFLGVFALVGAAITLATSTIGLFVNSLVLLGRALQAVGATAAALRFLPLIFAGFSAALVPVIATIGLVALAFEGSRNKIIEIWQGLRDQVVAITAGLVKTILESLGAQQGDTAFSWLKRSWDKVWEEIKSLAPQNAREVFQLITSLSLPGQAFKWLRAAWDTAWNDIKGDAPRKLIELVQFIISLTPPAQVFKWLKDAWDEAWKEITGTTKEKADQAAKAVAAVEPSTEELQTALGDVANEADRAGDRLIKNSQKSVIELDKQTQAATKLESATKGVKPPNLAGAGLPDFAGQFDKVTAAADAAGKSVRDLESRIAGLATETDDLELANSVERSNKKFEENERKIESNRRALARLADERRAAALAFRLAQEQEAAAERARIGFQAVPTPAEARPPATPKIIQAPTGPVTINAPGAKIIGAPTGIPAVQAPPGGQVIQAPGVAALEQAATQAAAGLSQLTQDEAQRVDTLSQSAEGAAQALQSIDERADAAAQSFGNLGSETSDTLRQAADQLAQELQGVNVDDALRGISDSAGQLDSALDGLTSAAGSAETALEGLDEGGGGFAGGGFVSGPGTSTSDSILARLSRGEFVVRAAAVQHFGPSFFAALNALRMPKFSMGGIVDGLNQSLSSLAIPRFADGGLAVAPATSSRTPITLVMPDGRKVGGLFATDTAVTQLRREVVSQQVTSAGRKPNWVR